MERATAQFGHLRFVVVDLGQHACSTTGACFWLCLSAGLSVSDWHIHAQALPGIADCESLLAEIRQSAPHLLDSIGDGGFSGAQVVAIFVFYVDAHFPNSGYF